MLKIHLGFLLFLAVALSSCATPVPVGMETNVISQSEYEHVLDPSTKSIETYDGLYNTINMTATLLRLPVAEAQLKQTARMYQWNPTQFQEEKTKMNERLKSSSEMFVSFYTPERKNDDLQKSQTLWKIFLDVGGKRFEGKASKIKLSLSETQGKYPYHNRFATPYKLTFPVPTANLEGQEVKLTITGSVGSATLIY